MKFLTLTATSILLILTGCSTKQEDAYYKAVDQQNKNYMQAYSTIENESVTFDGTFEGKINIVKPKKLPQIQQIQKPKTGSEVALQWAQTIVPVAGMVAGMHYNYKSLDSSNQANSRQIEAYTGNYQNNTSTVDTSVSSTSVNDTSVTDTSVTTEKDNTSVTNPIEYTDGTVSITNP